MKKSLMMMCISVLMIFYAIPTIAEVKIGGIIFTDAWYEFQDSENTGTKDDVAKFKVQIPNISRLHGKWTSDNKDTGMWIELGLDGNGVGERDVCTRQAYGWWQVNPLLRITAGQTVTGFSPLFPQQMLGTETSRINLIGGGFGDLYSGRIPLVRFTLTPSKELTVDVAFSDPDIRSAGFADAITKGTNNTSLPRIDLSSAINAGPLTLYPGFMFANKTFTDVPDGGDDSITTYAVSLGAKANFGPVCIKGEVNFGQNWGNQDFLSIGKENTLFGGAVSIGNNKIEDSDMFAGWLDAGITVEAAEIHTIFGIQSYANDRLPQTNEDDFEQTVMMFGFSVPVKVTDNFKIRPEIILYDLGERENYIDNLDGTYNDEDRGKYVIAGVQFQITF
ncbi:MAG: hypothetical protein HQK75_20050 [Candidatus Magnetomorum sp.]|nr:hypothetical protein [Candidatus Magnetomorum sp.]